VDELWDELSDELSDEKRDEVNDVSPEYELEVSYDILFCELLELLELGNSGNLKFFTLF